MGRLLSAAASLPLAISIESDGEVALNVSVINSAQTAFVISLLAISYFIFDVTEPKKIEIASNRIKETIDQQIDSQRTGDLRDFVRNYNSIESLLIDHALEYTNKMQISASPSEYDYKKYRKT